MIKKLSTAQKVLLGVGCILLAGILLFCLWFFNGIYYDTPLEVLEAEKDSATMFTGEYLSDELFTVKELLDIIEIEDEAKVLYISEADTFTAVSCEYSSLRKKWSYIGISFSGDPENSTSVYKKGDSLEYAGDKINTTVYGVKLADGSVPYVDGKQADVKTYEFSLRGKVYGVEFWSIEGITNDDFVVEFR